MGETEIRQYISHLAVNAKISASTQTVALSALLFLYREVLKKELPYVANIERAKRQKTLLVVSQITNGRRLSYHSPMNAFRPCRSEDNYEMRSRL